MIDDSVEQVEAGSRLVDQAGGTMNEVVFSIHAGHRYHGGIAAASREQEAGIGQINQAIVELDARWWKSRLPPPTRCMNTPTNCRIWSVYLS